MKKEVTFLLFLMLIIPITFAADFPPDPDYFLRQETYEVNGKVTIPIEMREKDAIEFTFCDQDTKIILSDIDYSSGVIEAIIERDVYTIAEGGIGFYDVNIDGEKDIKLNYIFLQKGKAHIVMQGLMDCEEEIVEETAEEITGEVVNNETVENSNNFVIQATSADSTYWKYSLYGIIALIVLYLLLKIKILSKIVNLLRKLKPKKKAKQQTHAQVIQREHIACPSCARDTVKGDKFCINCGEKLVEKKKYCINCGAELRKDSKFCPECGEKAEI